MFVYVDIDDTLMRSYGEQRIPIAEMVALVPRLKDQGATLYCWSSAGAEYAQRSAQELGIAECFSAFLPKPQMVIDDTELREWKLVELHPNECRSLSAFELLARIGRLTGGDQ